MSDYSGLFLVLSVRRDGKTISTPRLWLDKGEGSIIAVGDWLQLQVVIGEIGEGSAELRFKVSQASGDAFVSVAEPRLQAAIGRESSFELQVGEHALRVGVVPFAMGLQR